MRVIVFLGIAGLSLAGFRVDKHHVPHVMPHHHHAIQASEHGHGHGDSNSENSEELFNLAGAIQDGTTVVPQAIPDGTGITIPVPIHMSAEDIGKIVEKGAAIAGAASALAFVDLQGIIENDIQGTIDTIQGDITGTVDTIHNALQGTANTVTNAVESITPAEAAATGNAIASTIGTGLKLGNSALQDVNDGLGIANAVIP